MKFLKDFRKSQLILVGFTLIGLAADSNYVSYASTTSEAKTVGQSKSRYDYSASKAKRGNSEHQNQKQTRIQNCCEQYFQRIRHNPSDLKLFVERMPKGAELHTHLSGIPTPEELLKIASNKKRFRFLLRLPANEHWIRDPDAYSFVAMPPVAALQSSQFMSPDSLLPPKTVRVKAAKIDFNRAQTVSTQDSDPHQKFCEVIFQRRRSLVREMSSAETIAKQAVIQASKQRLCYIEIQVDPSFVDPLPVTEKNEEPVASSTLPSGKQRSPLSFERLKQNLIRLDRAADSVNASLQPSKRVCVRFLISLNRENPGVLGKLPLAFALASDPTLSKIVAGINLCGDEYPNKQASKVKLIDPLLVAKTIRLLRKKYPSVALSIHAGESRKWDNHISEALMLGATRIGHGVNLGINCKESKALRKVLAKRKILVEACPTSNQILLGLPVQKQQLIKLLHEGIPVSISTDDGGIFGTTMSSEFQKLIQNHPQLAWRDIKELGRNSLRFAFLPDQEKQSLLSRFETEMLEFEKKHSINKSAEVLIPLRLSEQSEDAGDRKAVRLLHRGDPSDSRHLY